MAKKELKRLEGEATDDPMLPYDYALSPVQYLDFKGKWVAYQIFEGGGDSQIGIFVRGYKVSEPYRTEDGTSAIWIETLPPEDRADFQQSIMSKFSDRRVMGIGFW